MHGRNLKKYASINIKVINAKRRHDLYRELISTSCLIDGHFNEGVGEDETSGYGVSARHIGFGFASRQVSEINNKIQH